MNKLKQQIAQLEQENAKTVQEQEETKSTLESVQSELKIARESFEQLATDFDKEKAIVVIKENDVQQLTKLVEELKVSLSASQEAISRQETEVKGKFITTSFLISNK